MKRRITLFTIILLMLMMSLPVMANDEEEPAWLSEIRRELLGLGLSQAAIAAEIARINAQLEGGGGGGGGGTPQPTPAPVFAPNLRLLSPQNVSIEPGETIEIPLVFRNIGTHTAFNLLTQVSAPAAAPFTVEFINDTNLVNQVRENTNATMTLRITAGENTEPGVHNVEIAHFFRTQDRENERSTDSFQVRVGGGVAGTSNVRLTNIETPSVSLAPGTAFSLDAVIQNIGTIAARDVQIRLPDSGGTDDIIFTGNLNDAFFAAMDANFEARRSFSFMVSRDASPGPHAVSFLVTQRNTAGQIVNGETFTVFVNVLPAAEAGRSNLEARNMTAPSGNLRVGETGSISFTLVNTSAVEARNINIVATPESETAIVPMGTANTQNIQRLAPGESRVITFSFSPTSTAVTRSYTVGFNISFDDDGGERISFSQFSQINVWNPEPDDDDDDEPVRTQIPRIIVSEYAVHPQIPRAGQEFAMDITFRNTNATRSINNVRIVMEALEGTQGQGAVFTPVGGSNTLFIDFLAPGQEVTKNLRFFTVNDADPRSYNMRVTFDYQDQDFAELTASENLSISVAQIVRIETQDLNIEPSAALGSNIWTRFSIINAGRVSLHNVRVRVDGPFDATHANTFIGPLTAGRAITYDGQFVPLESGRVQGAIVIYGEDATGAIVEYIHEFTLEVSDPADMGYWGEDWGGDWGDDISWGGDIGWGDDRGHPLDPGFPQEDSSFDFIEFISRPYVWGTAAGVVLLAVVVIVIVVKKRNSKLGFIDEE